MSNTARAAVTGDFARPQLSLRQCLGHFATGVTVVTYAGESGPAGVTVNSFTSVSLDPPLVLICLDKRSRAIAHVTTKPFTINVLHAQQQALAWHFAGRPSAELQAPWAGAAGAPLLADCLAWLACEPWVRHEAGDHVIVLGRVVDYSASELRPLCFFRGQFQGLSAESTRLPSD